jgi:hypothetical protein
MPDKETAVTQYKVIGTRAVAGVAPGGVVELAPEDAAYLVEIGHLEVFATRKSKTTPETSEGGE